MQCYKNKAKHPGMENVQTVIQYSHKNLKK